ncbi:MAG: bifunctional glutamate N-acetyltransferase/amino-acid acetyltransferase ArgJ [Verrucomicrobiales bacterium]|nr:bifunctional glutamate N-acetyltransferase/amino-acid acetyltransferase ArgJ [Verrucomicrobiales bacterium]
MSSKIEFVEGGVCVPRGFRSAAVSCGIKNPDVDRLDLGLIFSKFPTVSAGAFTQNAVRAACVEYSVRNLAKAEPRAIVVNSGNANACTGPSGMRDVRLTAREVAKNLGILQREVLVCSTGIIGMEMPMDRILPNMPDLAEKLKRADEDVTRAIMTSDTKPKSVAAKFKVGGKEIRIGAIAKGAGMINPNMATMLCFVTTDAHVSKSEIQSATREAVEDSFNRITIDGDTSTNDSVIVMANHRAENRMITKGGAGSGLFRQALSEVMLRLARKMVSDGERVTKLVTVCVRGARSKSDAEKVARTVAHSSLVKCSWNGNDPNWGRVIHAIGYSGARVREETVDIYFDGLLAAQNGMTAKKTPLKELVKAVSGPEFTVGIDLHLGKGEYSLYTADLSPEYVEFNREEYAAAKQKGLKSG